MWPVKPRFKLRKRLAGVKRRRKVEVFPIELEGAPQFESNISIDSERDLDRASQRVDTGAEQD